MPHRASHGVHQYCTKSVTAFVRVLRWLAETALPGTLVYTGSRSSPSFPRSQGENME